MMGPYIKWIIAALLLAAWFALVILGRSDVNDFVAFVKTVLVGLGAHQLTITHSTRSISPTK